MRGDRLLAILDDHLQYLKGLDLLLLIMVYYLIIDNLAATAIDTFRLDIRVMY